MEKHGLCMYIQLYMKFFNQINSWFVQAFKVACLAVAIVHGYIYMYFEIRSNPIISAFCAALHVAPCVCYNLAFLRAHHIPEMQEKLKWDITALTERIHSSEEYSRKFAVKSAAALRSVGVRVGSFHEMERNSALNFMHFVETQLISLLVAS